MTAKPCEDCAGIRVATVFTLARIISALDLEQPLDARHDLITLAEMLRIKPDVMAQVQTSSARHAMDLKAREATEQATA